MSVSALTAAKTLAEASEWRLSHLALQKILYLANMMYTGWHAGEPLISESFEASDYGPILPSLYRKASIFGNRPVENIFHSVPDVADAEAEFFLKSAAEGLGSLDAAQLVALTQRENGAWTRHYLPGKESEIEIGSILAEYYTLCAKGLRTRRVEEEERERQG